MTRLDVSFLGREPRPIVVKTARRIERDADFRFFKGLGIGLLLSALLWAGIVCLWR
jgi:hypothetical protein